MRVITATVAGLGLLAAACSPSPSRPEPSAQEEKPVARTTSDPDPFTYAVNYACDGGGAIDVVFNRGDGRDILMRIDGGAPLAAALDTDSQTGIAYKAPEGQLTLEGPGIVWTSGGANKQCRLVARPLPPPIVDGAKRALTIADAGKSIDMKVGETITVALAGVPTAGYVWGVSEPPAFVKVKDGPGGPTSTAQFTPGFAGGNHWEVIIIEAVASGEGEITLAQRRPWEDKAEPAAGTFKFRLKSS